MALIAIELRIVLQKGNELLFNVIIAVYCLKTRFFLIGRQEPVCQQKAVDSNI